MKAGEAKPDAFKVVSLDGAAGNPYDAIFPIVSQKPDGTFISIGTGFFVTQNGVFITAAHVINEVIANGSAKAPLGLFQFLDGCYVLRPIAQSTIHPLFDLAIGVASPMTHNVTGLPLANSLLTISRNQVNVGSLTHTFAFPETRIEYGEKQIVEFHPGYYEGIVTDYFPNGRDAVILPGPCYQTSAVVRGGSSGGPVFNASGSVFGVNSTAFGEDHLSFVSCITSILDLAIDGVLMPGESASRRVSIRELCDGGFVIVR